MFLRIKHLLSTGIISTVLLLTTCTAYIEAFNFTVEDNIIDYRTRLRDVNKRPRETEGYVIQDNEPFIYAFEPALNIQRSDAVLILQYDADFPDATLTLFDAKTVLLTTILSTAGRGMTLEHVVPLEKDMHITSFMLNAKGLRIKELILARATTGDSLSETTVGGFSPVHFSYYTDMQNTRYLRVPAGGKMDQVSDNLVFEFPAYPASLEQDELSMIHLAYNAGQLQQEMDLPLSIESNLNTMHYLITLRPRVDNIYIPVAPGAVRMTFSFSENMPITTLTSFSVSQKPAGLFPTPIPADIHIIADFPQPYWRNQDYELFSWSLYPNILILYSATLEKQARFFKRLAFFVEKEGYRTKLLSNEFLSSRHGWNAHNYRAEDLANFFNQVDMSAGKVALNPEEIELKAILLENGVITGTDGRYLPGKGGILAVAANMSNSVRYKLLVHEALHGVFYEEEEYRKVVQTLWNSLSEEEREFWRFMLKTLSYDSSDEYLTINEFHAYLLQQDIDIVASYYNNTMKFRLQRFSSRDRYIANAISQYNFEEHARYLQEKFFSKRNLKGSNLQLVKIITK